MLHFDAVPESVRNLLARLDFFTTSEFAPEELFEKLALHPATVTGRAANTRTIDAGGVKLDLLRHAYPALQPAERTDGVLLVSLPDLAAMKLNAIANRGSKKDFYDLVELLRHFTLQQMIGFFAEKYPSTDPFIVIRSLAWFDDAEQEPDPISLNGRSWDEVKALARNAVAGL